MSGKGYTVPIGVDLGNTVKDLDNLLDKIDATKKGALESGKAITNNNNAIAEGATKSTDALKRIGVEVVENRKKAELLGRAIDETFDGKSAQEFEKRTKAIDAEMRKLRDAAKAAGKEIRDGITSGASDAEMEKKLQKFQKLLADLNGKNAEMGFTIDDSAFEEFQNKLAATGGDLKQLGLVVDFAREKLATLSPGTDEFNALNAQIQIADGFLEGLGTTADEVTRASTTLKSELRRVKEELAQMELAGQGGTELFQQMSERAGELEDQIGDVSSRVRVLASDTKYLDAGVQAVTGLVGAFTAGQGALALFGAENEEFEKVIQRVTGAMAVLQGIQAVADALNKDNALSVLFLRSARTQETAATVTQTAATAGQAAATEGATIATKGLGVAMKTIGIGLIIAAVAYLITKWDDLKASITKLFPALKDTDATFNKVKQTFFGVGNVVIGVGKAVVTYLIAPIGILIKLMKGDFEGAAESFKSSLATIKDGLNVSANFQKGVAIEVANQAEAKRRENLEKLIKNNEKLLEVQKAAGKNTVALERKILQDKAELAKGDKDAQEEIIQERAVFEAGAAKAAAEARKKALEEAEKRAKEAAQQAQERNKQLIALSREANDLTIAAMKEGVDKEKALLAEEYRRKVEDAENIVALTSASEAKKQAIILKLREEQLAKEGAINLKYATEAVQRQLAIDKLILDSQKASQEKELQQADLGLQEKLLSLRKDGLLTVATEKAIRAQNAQVKAEINQRYKLQEIENQKEISIAKIEGMDAGGKSEIAFEKLKENLKTRVLLDSANQRLRVLKAIGGEENQVAIAQLEATIKGYQDAINKNKSADKVNLFEFLGLDESRTKDFADALSNAGQLAADVFGEIANGIQKQIDAKQNQIDAFTSQIDQLESELDREKDLQEQGLANNVALKEQEIAAVAAQKDKIIKQQEDLQKKQQQMQKAQIIADTFAQSSNLITASTDIFKAFAKIPFVGVPLAITAIGAMLGGFALAKINAFKAVSSGQKFGGGGEFILDGPSHSSGGLGVYDEKTGKRVAEVEGGEGFFAINKKATKKHRGLLEAINNDDFSHFTAFSASLDQMLADSGISFPHEDMANTVIIAQNANARESEYKSAVTAMSNRLLKKIADNTDKLVDMEKDKPEVIDTEETTVIKKGNHTRIIRKKNG